MTDPDLTKILAAMRDEPLPFGSVEERIAAEIARRARRRSVPLWAWPLAAAALLILTLWIRPAWRVEPLPAVDARHIPAPEIRKTNPIPVVTVRQVRRKTPTQPQPPAETFTVKLLTADPDVVIYWIVGGQGE